MAYTLDFSISLGSTKTGLTLNGQLVDTAGVDVGVAIVTGFTEIGNGCYLLDHSTIPDDHRGGIKIYASSVPGTILAFGSINPEEAEYLDVAVSTRSTLTQADILSDATPFAGSNIDTNIGSRSSFDNVTDEVIVSTNNDKTNYELSAGSLSDIDVELSATHGSGSWESGLGSGLVAWDYVVDDGTNGIPAALVVVTTDAAGSISVAHGYTNNFGIVTFHLDAGTYYFWTYKADFTFTNPDSEVVA